MKYSYISLFVFVSLLSSSLKASTVKNVEDEITLSFIPKAYRLDYIPEEKGVAFRVYDKDGISDENHYFNSPPKAAMGYLASCDQKTNITFMFTNTINNIKDTFKLFIDTEKNLLSVHHINTQCDVFLNLHRYTVQFGTFEDNKESIKSYINNKENALNSYFSTVKTPGKFWVWGKALSMEWSDIECNWLRCDTQGTFAFGSLYSQDLLLKDPKMVGTDKVSYGFSTQSRLKVDTDLIICAPDYTFISGDIKAYQLYLMDSFDLYVLYLTVKTPIKKLIRYEDFIVESIKNLGASIKTSSNFWFVTKKFNHVDMVQEVKVNNAIYNLPMREAPHTDAAEVYCNVDEISIKAKRLENFTLNNKTVYFQLCQIIREDNYKAGIVEKFHNFTGNSYSVFKQASLKDSPKNLDEADLYVDFAKIKTGVEEEITHLKTSLGVTHLSITKQFKGDKKHFDVTPDRSEFWQNLLPFKDEIYTNAEDGDDCRYYVWDKEFNDIDSYDAKGLHLGCINPLTGEVYHDKLATRSIKISD